MLMSVYCAPTAPGTIHILLTKDLKVKFKIRYIANNWGIRSIIRKMKAALNLLPLESFLTMKCFPETISWSPSPIGCNIILFMISIYLWSAPHIYHLIQSRDGFLAGKNK